MSSTDNFFDLIVCGYSRTSLSIPNDIKQIIIKYYKNDLIIHKNEKISLKSNIMHYYTNIIIKENGILTTNGYQRYRNKDGGTLLLNISNAVYLMNSSTISLNGLGYQSSEGPGRGRAAGGAGYATKGTSLRGSKYCGQVYGTKFLDVLYLGSGGGHKNRWADDEWEGGPGGGAIKIIANKIIIMDNAGIYCNGLKGERSAGAGSGGSIYIICNKLNNNGVIMSKGGNNNAGNGRIRIDCSQIIQKGIMNPLPYIHNKTLNKAHLNTEYNAYNQ